MPGQIDFDTLADQATAPAVAPPPPSSANFDDLAGQVIDMQAAVDRQRAQKNLVQAQGSNPDSEAKALQASKALGIPQPAASANLQEATQSADLQKNMQTLAAAPGLSSFIGSNPLAARIAQDDFDKLGTLDRMWTALKTGAATAIDSNALGRLGNDKQAETLFGADSSQTDQAIQTLEGRVAATPRLTGALGTVQQFTGFVAGIVNNAIVGGGLGAGAGAAVGGGLGAAAGGVGAIPGAVAGAGTGALIGFNADMAQVAAGNAYLKMGQMRGADGQPLSEAGKQFGAIFTGAATYALGTYGGAVESKLLGGNAEKIAQQAVEQAVTTPTFARAAASFAGSTAKGAAAGAGFMTAMEASNIVGEQIAKALTAGNFGTDPQEIVNRLSEAALNGALTLGALHATMGGIGLYGDARTAVRAQAQATMFKNILEGAAESKTRQRDLDTFQQFMQAQTNGSPVEDLHVPASKIRELYQGMAIDPANLEPGRDPVFGFVPDMAKQLADAENNGGDVVIPTADFVAHLAGSPVAEKLLPDIRVGADAMSLNEAKQFQEEYEARIKRAVDEAAGAKQEADSAQQIAEDVRQKAIAAGRPAAEASRYGQIFASRYVARAERRGLGEDPAALYKAEGVQIGEAAGEGRILNQGAVDQTTTPEFKKWFGKSKVVDEDGVPQVMYHGTGADIESFKGKQASSIFVADHPIVGEAYAEASAQWLKKHGMEGGANIMPVFAKAEHPFDYENSHHVQALVDRLFKDTPTHEQGDGQKALILDGKNTLYTEPVLREALASGDWKLIESPEVQKAIKAEGHDSFYVHEDGFKNLGLHNPEQLKSAIGNRGTFDANDQRIHYQDERGKIQFNDAQAVISLFEKADSSTLIHEGGHAWLEELAADAGAETAPAQLRDDIATVREWLGNDGGEFTTEQHEQFARAAEAYLMEGKAPSRALGRVFSRFKQWLTKIYRTVAALDTPINDDIRGVFDRLLATDAELAEATKSTGLEPNFADRKQAGMTQAEWGAYLRTIDRANQQAESTMLDKMMATVRRQRTAEYREERAKVEDDVAKTVDARPDMQALNLLRSGKMPDGSDIGERIRLNTNFVVEVYGKDGLEALPKGITSKDGFDPAYVSEMLGFDSPDEMIRGLQSLEGQQREIRQAEGEKRGIRQYLIDQETDARMAERKGELTDEASIKDEAVAALHGEGQEELLTTELRYLRRMGAQALLKQGERRSETGTPEPKEGDAALKSAQWNEQAEKDMTAALRESVTVIKPMLEAMRGRVDQVLAGKTTAEIGRFNSFLRDERKAAREVQEAILAKDWGAAAAAKQRQIISHILYTKARAAAAEVERSTRNFERATAKPSSKSTDAEYNNQIQDLLGRFGFDSGRGAELQRTKGGTLQEFVQKQSEDHGIELQVDPALFEFAGKPVGDLTLGEFRALDEAVRSMQEMGRGLKMIEVDGVKRDFDEVRDEVVAAIRDLGERMKSDYYDPADAGKLAAAKEAIFHTLRGIDASLTKPEALFDQIDRGDPLGIMNRAVFRRLKEAQHREDRTQEVAAKALKDAVADAGKGWQKHLRDALPDDPNLRNPETGRPMKLTRQRMLSIALNWGNDGNRIKLADGYRWDPRAVKSFLDKNMTKADWDFVQSVWKIFDANKADLDALQKRVTGVGLDLVQADRFSTPHGEYEGGYYPIVYDAARDQKSETHAEKNAADTLFPNGYTRATTPKGSTISRVEGVKRPIQLSLDVAPWKIGQTLHDLAFREAIMDADRLLGDGAVKRAFDDVFGSEYRKTLRPWLKHVANVRNIDDAAISWIDKAIQTARTNTVMVGIGFRLSTILKHDLTALANSIGEIGAKEMLTATRDLYRPGDDGSNSWQFIFDKSAEMKYRQNAYDKDITAQYDKLLGDNAYTKFQKQAQHYGHLAVSKLDMGTAGPVWLSSYRKALAEGRNDADAVYLADKSVRNAHGAQGITDTAAIQRARGAAQLINMFYGFFNHVYNRQRLIAMDAASGVKNAKAGAYREATRDFASVLARSFWYIAVPGLIEAIVATQGPNENKDEGWGEWSAKAVLGSVPAGIPIMRDIAKAVLEGRDYEGSPLVNAVNSVIRGGVDLAHIASGEETSGNTGKHIATAAGLVAGLPTAAPFTAGKFLWDYGNGEASPESLGDWYRGLTSGKTQP